MPKVSIIGAGNVGATAAHIIAAKDLADVVLLDLDEGIARGKALDLMHLRSVEGFDARIDGTADYADTAGSDVVVVTAGMARKPGMTREDLLGVNAGIVRAVVAEAAAASPNAVFIVVTNPLDLMTHLAWKTSGLPAARVLGMGGVLDSARFSFAICEALGARPCQVEAWTVGAHGEGMLCWPRLTKVDGRPLTELAGPEQIEALVERTVKGGAEVVGHLKTGSAYYAPGASIARMVAAILGDTGEVVSACTHLDGAYGIDDVYMNVPVRLGREGALEVVEFPLDEREGDALKACADKLRDAAAKLDA